MKAGLWWAVGLGFALLVELLVFFWSSGKSVDPFATILMLIPLIGAGLVTPLVRPDARARTRLVIPAWAADTEIARMLVANWEIATAFFVDVRWLIRAQLVGFAIGTSACVAFSVAAALTQIRSAEPLVVEALSEKVDASVARGLVAVVFLAAIVTVFGLSSGSICMRVARRDITPRYVASQIRSVLSVALSALVSGGLFVYAGIVDCWPKAFAAGGAVGLLGEQLLSTAFDSIALIFGVSLGGDQLDEFDLIQGLDDDERLRLKELGVQSIQGLAFASTSSLYMSSRYPYQCVCDWQDQALLVLHLGERRARVFQRHGLRRASEVESWLGKREQDRMSALANEFSRQHREVVSSIEALARERNFSSERELEQLRALAHSVSATELAADRGDRALRAEFEKSLDWGHEQVDRFCRDLETSVDARIVQLGKELSSLLAKTANESRNGSAQHLVGVLTNLGFKSAEEQMLALDSILADPQTLQMVALRQCYPALDGASSEPAANNKSERQQLAEPEIGSARNGHVEL